MPRGLPRLRRLSRRQPARRCQRRFSISKTMTMKRTRYALAGPAPPSLLLPRQPTHRLTRQVSPLPPHASVFILPLLPGACAFAELDGVEAASVRRVFIVRRGRCTYVARVKPTWSVSGLKTAACSDFRHGAGRAFRATTLSFGFDAFVILFFSFNEQ
jgi:hypothetical protein